MILNDLNGTYITRDLYSMLHRFASFSVDSLLQSALVLCHVVRFEKSCEGGRTSTQHQRKGHFPESHQIVKHGGRSALASKKITGIKGGKNGHTPLALVEKH